MSLKADHNLHSKEWHGMKRMSYMKVLLYALILCVFSVGFVFAEDTTTVTGTEEKVLADDVNATEADTNVTAVDINATEVDANATEQVILYEGNLTLPDGNVTVEASSGKSYEFPALTPMGALLTAAKDANLSIEISDKPMEHKGILALDGIDNYTYGANNTWFAVVNDYQLQEYVTPATDGMNVYSVQPGDKLGFYYGLPIKAINESQAAVLLTIE